MHPSTLETPVDVENDGPIEFMDLSKTRRDFLVVIYKHEPIKAMVAAREVLGPAYGRDLKQSAVYRTINALSDEGLIKKRPLDGKTNVLFVTDEGESQVDAYRKWIVQ